MAELIGRVAGVKGNRFILFSAGYNGKKWMKRHFDRLHEQTHKNYIHVVIDDASTDGSYEEILKHADDRTVVYRNEKNMGWVWNAASYLSKHIQSPEDIIVGYDLDDWFAHDEVLERVNEIYTQHDCWVTYGGFVRSTGRMRSDNWQGYSEEVIMKREFRKTRWRFWAMRTFKAFLWKAINKEDFKGPDGKWPKTTYDYAIGFPLLELCPPDRLHHVGREVLYIYNYSNPLNDKKINKAEQQKIGYFYVGKRPYQIIEQKGVVSKPQKALPQVFALPDRAPSGVKESRIIVLSIGANCKHFVKNHLQSVKRQNYSNFVHVVVDDASVDNTVQKIEKYQHKKMRLHRNKKNVKWLCNAERHLPKHMKNEEDIIVVLDLDDWFANDIVLEKINYMYELSKCWLTYGQCKFYHSMKDLVGYFEDMQEQGVAAKLGINEAIYLKQFTLAIKKGWNIKVSNKGKKPKSPIPMDIVIGKRYREENISSATHPKTFKKFLWDAIDKKDFRGPDGEYIPNCYDRAIMYPMLEMCPPEKIRFINEVLTIYNSSNPLCVGWVNRKQQVFYEKWIAQKSKYKELMR